MLRTTSRIRYAVRACVLRSIERCRVDDYVVLPLSPATTEMPSVASRARVNGYPSIADCGCTPMIKSHSVPVPPRAGASAIVRFLDHADRRIRRAIRAKQKLIALLNEQKQAVIHRAVTRGLDPNVRLKPSGVDWLGDVPEHWEVRALRHLLRRVDEQSRPAPRRLSTTGSAACVLFGDLN